MAEPQSQWQTQELATAFLEGVRGAIPGADLQLDVITKIIALWSPPHSRILDLGCGDGILGRLLLDRFHPVQVTFIDFSEPMLAAAREKLKHSSKATVHRADFSKPAWLDSVAGKWPFDVVVSGFAIHHQPDLRKKELYAEIHGILAPGGVFLNLEHVAFATRTGEKLFDDFFVDHLLRSHQRTKPGIQRQEIEETYHKRPDKKENILAPLEVQCDWLREIGFQDVDCFLKVFELALFGGRKARPNSHRNPR